MTIIAMRIRPRGTSQTAIEFSEGGGVAIPLVPASNALESIEKLYNNIVTYPCRVGNSVHRWESGSRRVDKLFLCRQFVLQKYMNILSSHRPSIPR